MSQTSSKNAHNKHIKKLEEQLSYFASTNVLTEGLVTSLNKVIALFKEQDEDYEKLSDATRSRHKAARGLLYLILQNLGYDAFFLCAFALPITRLGTIKAHAEFLGVLRTWWTRAKVPSTFSDLTGKLREQHVLPTKGLVSATPQKRSWTEQWSGEQQTLQGSSNKRRGGKEKGQVTELYSFSDGGTAGPALETEEEVEEDEEEWVDEEDEEDERDEDEGDGGNLKRLEEQLEGPLAGVVYKLERMDAILVLASSKANVLLTMPHRRRAKPFISFECSEKLALRFLRKRTQVMELSQPPELPQLIQSPQSLLLQRPQMLQHF